MSTIDVLETEFNLKGNYEKKMRDAKAATSAFASDFDKVSRAQMIGNFAANMTMAAGAVVALGVAMGSRAMRDSAQFDSLVKGLESVEGSAKEAQKQLEKLKIIAEGPGIGFEESVTGYGGLRRSGVSQGMSERLVREAGNLNASSGGDVAKFERIMLAFSQIASKPQLMGQELLQLNEAGVPIQKLLKEAFGTADTDELRKRGLSGTEVLEKLVATMEKMPRVGGGFQNVLDNFADTMKFASVEVGNGLNESLLPMLGQFTEGIREMTEDGTLKNLGDSIGQTTKTMLEAAGGARGLAEKLSLVATAMMNATKAGQQMWEFQRKTNPFWALSDWLYGGDIHRAAAEVDAKNAEMEQDPRVKGVLERQAAAQKLREEERRKKEDQEKQRLKSDPATNLLAKIEANTRILPEIARAAWGGGELARIGVTPHEIKAARAERKIARDLRRYAQIAAVPTIRSSGR